VALRATTIRFADRAYAAIARAADAQGIGVSQVRPRGSPDPRRVRPARLRRRGDPHRARPARGRPEGPVRRLAQVDPPGRRAEPAMRKAL